MLVSKEELKADFIEFIKTIKRDTDKKEMAAVCVRCSKSCHPCMCHHHWPTHGSLVPEVKVIVNGVDGGKYSFGFQFMTDPSNPWICKDCASDIIKEVLKKAQERDITFVPTNVTKILAGGK
jgi:hypothetical protein